MPVGRSALRGGEDIEARVANQFVAVQFVAINSSQSIRRMSVRRVINLSHVQFAAKENEGRER